MGLVIHLGDGLPDHLLGALIFGAGLWLVVFFGCCHCCWGWLVRVGFGLLDWRQALTDVVIVLAELHGTDAELLLERLGEV